MTMNTLFQAAEVLRGDGDWTYNGGYETDDLSCGRKWGTTDLCLPTALVPTDSAVGYKVVPFAINGAQKFGIRCEPKDSESALTEATEPASEYYVAKQLWNGDTPSWAGVGTGMFLADAGITTQAAGANVPASIAAALITAAALHPEAHNDRTVHLGLGAAYGLPSGFVADHPEVEFVQSPAYPTAGIAVTGPITIHLGTVETLIYTDQTVNREWICTTRIAAVDFDPCLAVRVV